MASVGEHIGSVDTHVRVRGAREHNLRSVDVDLPRDAIVAFTGVSGSGKSSLAFGTLYAEAQRRYFESVAPYARRLLQQTGAPEVDEITGLPPAVALQQRRGTATSRSTVGTLTTLSNLVRILYSRSGTYPAGSDRLPAEAFSPNTPAGACDSCHGLGFVHDVTEDLLVPDPTLSIREGAIAAWPGAWQGHNLRRVAARLGVDVDAPWQDLPDEVREWVLFTDERPSVLIRPRDKDGGGGRDYQGVFRSARDHVHHTLRSTSSEAMRKRMLAFVRRDRCTACDGSGLRPQARAVTFTGRSIVELNAMPLRELLGVVRGADASTSHEATHRILLDLAARVGVLVELGLGYLALNRGSTTLSGGEAQRLRVATQLRSGLFGVVYVLDEPSAGLHPADTEPLLQVLRDLKKGGNTLFVVEHDMDVVGRADWVVDIGPAAGENGGQVVYSGTVPGLASVRSSVTSRYLSDRSLKPRHQLRQSAEWLRLEGVTRNNLRDLDVEIPLHSLTAVTGVSGSGKSTLVSQVLAGQVRTYLGEPIVDDTSPEGDEPVDEAARADPQREVRRATGLETIDRVVVVDQRPIGRTPRSNLATYTGLFDTVRRIFAAVPEARTQHLGSGHFSFNTSGGRCETCKGEGTVSVELLFLPGTAGPCPTCHGTRFDEGTLAIRYRGHNIADVLSMSVDTAGGVFADTPAAARVLATLHDVGLGYLTLGQPATELSGGEAQRIKLAAELHRAQRGQGLYLLDEPTSGLHPADAALLVGLLHRLVDGGNTVVIVEHDLDTVATTDWVVDLGPGGGDQGGRVVFAGTPQGLVDHGAGATSEHLRRRWLTDDPSGRGPGPVTSDHDE